MKVMNVPAEELWWYLDTRRFGTVPHAEERKVPSEGSSLSDPHRRHRKRSRQRLVVEERGLFILVL